MVDPPIPFLSLQNGATTGRPASLAISRIAAGGGERVTVSGKVAESQVVYRSVGDGVRYAGAVLRAQLEANGIRVAGGERIGAAPPAAVTLLEHEGIPLAEILRRLMKFSNNHIAEMLVKAMGRAASGEPGSWANGLAAMRERLRQAGVDLGATQVLDGSGLARGNRISPRVFVSALRAAANSFSFGPELVGSLPLSGTDGTLQRRKAGAAGTVRAKTGLLNGVTGLSGYAQRRDGTRLVFSVLANDYRCGDGEAMAAMDAFAEELTE
jgi:D-alanyl-D-alanine carboxypeptidase/D-alanyl-D-alanine-endopeptidase (penicillin-binding protein 4)